MRFLLCGQTKLLNTTKIRYYNSKIYINSQILIIVKIQFY
nr:MAG TPA: hypothetical protein [Crassvirales sp.]